MAVIAQRYELGQPLGSGGVATVYRGYDQLLNRNVAIKLLHQHLGQQQQADVLSEARTSAGLSHPNIVSIYDVGTDNGRPFLVMELLTGGSLRQRLGGAPLAIEDSVEIAQSIASALEAAHGQGILHLDVKPENILFTQDGRPKLGDFGISRPIGAGAHGPGGTMVGTPAYLAPEYVTGGNLDARADVYSLGVVLFEMLTGRTPFDGPTAEAIAGARLFQDPPDPQSLNPAIPPGLEQLLLKALSREPYERFGSAREFADALRNYERRSEQPTVVMQAGGAAVRPAPQRPAQPAQPIPPPVQQRPPAQPEPYVPPRPAPQPVPQAAPAEGGGGKKWLLIPLLLLVLGAGAFFVFNNDDGEQPPEQASGGVTQPEDGDGGENGDGGEPTAAPQTNGAGQERVMRIEDTAWVGSYRATRPTYGGRTATWIYGTSTSFNTMSAGFELQGTPNGEAQLSIEGMDSENSPKTTIKIDINGTEIYRGPNPLPDDDQPLETGTWATHTWTFDAGLLRQGRNTITISNLEVGAFGLPPFFMIDYADLRYRAR